MVPQCVEQLALLLLSTTASKFGYTVQITSVINMKSLIRRASKSLLGNILFFEVISALPLFILFLWLDFSDGHLTIDRAISSAGICLVAGAALGSLMWVMAVRPLLNRINAEKNIRVVGQSNSDVSDISLGEQRRR
jgi:hypothetical protein